MGKYRAAIQYLGARYAGWQVQVGQPTVQGRLQEALARVSGETTSVVGAGRTDAGVHALGQVAHFRLERMMNAEKLKRGLNGVLPGDIRIVALRRAAANFHAQKDALKKRYSYRIYNGPVLSPFLRGRVDHVVPRLDVEAMQQGAELVLGRHDFSGFAAAAAAALDRRRTVFLSQWKKKGRSLRYDIEADGFLHHMVRNIVGTLLQVGLGKRPPADVSTILGSRDRRNAGPTAAPCGLYLVRVWYPIDTEDLWGSALGPGRMMV